MSAKNEDAAPAQTNEVRRAQQTSTWRRCAKTKTAGSSKTERATNPSSRNGPGRGNQQQTKVFGAGGKLKSASGRTESWSGHQTPVKKIWRRSDESTGPETDAERQRLERGQDETLPNKSPAAGDRANDRENELLAGAQTRERRKTRRGTGARAGERDQNLRHSARMISSDEHHKWSWELKRHGN
jgi:hypothetical protein